MSGSTRATRRINGDLDSDANGHRLYLSSGRDWYIEFQDKDLVGNIELRDGGKQPSHAVTFKQGAILTEVRYVKAKKFLEKGCHPPKDSGGDNPGSDYEYETDPTSLNGRC